MGVYFGLFNEQTQEWYDLGKGPWYEIRKPWDHLEWAKVIGEYLREKAKDWGEPPPNPEHVRDVIIEVRKFVERSEPGDLLIFGDSATDDYMHRVSGCFTCTRRPFKRIGSLWYDDDSPALPQAPIGTPNNETDQST